MPKTSEETKMASKLDEFDMKAPVADLLYPSVEKHNAMKKRAAALEKLPRAFVDNLELEKVADFITPHYQYRVMRLFCEVCDDEEVINYRLDILDDFIRLPSLSATIRKVINVMVENDRKNIYNLTTPDSFSQLDDAISGFDAYIQCMEIMHDFYGKMKDKIHSEGVKKLFAFFEEHYGDKHYISLKGEIEKLKKALYDRIRSVTVAINLDERLVPVSAGIIELSKERYDIKPSLVDRILYHGAKFNDKAVVKNLRKKYNDSEVSDDKLINTVDKTLFDELSDLTDTFVKMIDKVLAEYQKAGIADMRYIDYQLEYYMGAVAVIEACEDQGLKMCRPKILPAGERKAVIKDIFDPVYFREARIYNLDHKEKKSVVTNDITMGGDSEGFYVLTGANNGGKTTFLRAVSQLDSIIRQQASQRRQTFTVENHVQHENVLADPNRLNQVLMNILSNAVKYTPQGGHIRLEVEELTHTEHYAKYRFVVQDDGIGMSEAYQKTLFEPFTREEKSGTNRVQGTGLGMAITKSIVDLMGGTIHVESAPGKGSRFEVVLELPIDAEADKVQTASALPEEDEAVSPLSGMKFLCAEDNAINAEILEMLLETKGASCTICSNGQEIVDAFASVKPGEYDMILMDVQMPVMDGLEATRRIRNGENPLGRIIPILAMTANAFLEDMQKSKEAGMDEHLSKPVDIAALEQTVKRFRVTPPPLKNSGKARFRR